MTHWDGSFYHAIAQHLPNPVVVADLDGRIVFANSEIERLAGRAVVGLHLDDLVAPEHAGMVHAWFESMSLGVAGRSVYLSALPVTWEGVDRWIELSGRELLSVEGFRGVVIALRDVTVHRQELEALQHHASHDQLTGLLNRSAMHQHLDVLAAAPEPSVLLFVDLDGFKMVNDVHGHEFGDRLLVATAERLAAGAPEAVIGRFGGDEFMVGLPGLGLQDGSRRAEELAELLAEPHVVDGEHVQVTVSIGAAVLDSSVEQAMIDADRAMFRAKSQGRNRVTAHDDEMRSWAVRRRDVMAELASLRAELEQALEQASAAQLDARTDDGTGLPNRRRLFEDLGAAHAARREVGRAFSIAFLDLDHFGRLNKERGDDEGDRTLRDVAAVLQATIREGEAVYRKGGEELVVILDDADVEGALAAGERLRRALEEAALPHGGVPGWPVVTVSVGVAEGSSVLPEETLRTAALCMLDAKARGRNRVSSTPMVLPVTSR